MYSGVLALGVKIMPHEDGTLRAGGTTGLPISDDRLTFEIHRFAAASDTGGNARSKLEIGVSGLPATVESLRVRARDDD
jgi:hypothetical protein